ncbi:MAG: ABC transporter ATP-binding protein, partial [Gammaproteobacteria bacterium]
FALVGESGCGKSMMALSIMRLLPEPAGRIVSGQIWLDGVELLGLPEVKMRRFRGGRIAMIFQEPMTSLNPVLTVGKQILESVQQHQSLRGAAARAQVVELLDAVGIPDAQRRYGEYPHQLSGGMKQRVMIAMALAGKPDVLIADEPTTALDVTIQAQVLELLKDLQRDTGMAVMLITHDLGVVAETADRVAVMYAGQIVEQASKAAFFQAPEHPYSQKLFESLPDTGKRDRALATIPGTVPALTQDFAACRFEPRCHRAWSLCKEKVPAWIKLGDGKRADRGVRCHLADARYTSPAQTREQEHKDAVSYAGSGSSDASQVLLEVRDLKVHFPIYQGVFRRVAAHVRAVDGVSLNISVGTTLALVGESGCGKTTVGKGILQLIRPTAGSVRFNNLELTAMTNRELRKHRRDFQIIFQDPFSSMNPRMRVGDIIEEGMRAQGTETNTKVRRNKVDKLLEQVGLSPAHSRRYPHEFSGGQRQRICIARALAVKPKLVICDEPTSALDVSVQAQILNLLQGLQRDMGLAYLFITHDLSVVSYLADQVAVMYLGKIVESGTVRQVLDEPLHPYTQALLSAVPQINPETRRAVIRLEGDIPSPVNPPAGCHFYPRCAHARPECRRAYPPVVARDGSHTVRCYLY